MKMDVERIIPFMRRYERSATMADMRQWSRLAGEWPVNMLRLGTPDYNRPGVTRVITFVSDRGYVAQALIAASQLAAQPDVVAIADIIIYLIDIPSDEQAAIQNALGSAHFNFMFLDSHGFLTDSADRLPEIHCPRSTLGRLVVDAEIPAQYDTVIYMDGDIQVVGPVAGLIARECEDGMVYAGIDRLDNGGRYANPPAYLQGIGVDHVSRYFNAGIMMANRATWRRVTAQALRFLAENPERCKHLDQSALNAVVGPHRRILSPEYNYTTWFRHADRHRRIDARIIHFTGPLKPWNTTKGPWAAKCRQVYVDFLAQYPYFERYMTVDTSRDVDPKYAQPTLKLRARYWLKKVKQAAEYRWHARLLGRFLDKARF